MPARFKYLKIKSPAPVGEREDVGPGESRAPPSGKGNETPSGDAVASTTTGGCQEGLKAPASVKPTGAAYQRIGEWLWVQVASPPLKGLLAGN
jgi:hypothetical protein